MKKTKKDIILDYIVGPLIAGLFALWIFALVVKAVIGGTI